MILLIELKKIMVSKAQIKASLKYDKKNTKGIYLKLNLKTDTKIINKLNNVTNKQGYIKQLINNDIEKNK